jgi:hypothetical protein
VAISTTPFAALHPSAKVTLQSLNDADIKVDFRAAGCGGLKDGWGLVCSAQTIAGKGQYTYEFKQATSNRRINISGINATTNMSVDFDTLHGEKLWDDIFAGKMVFNDYSAIEQTSPSITLKGTIEVDESSCEKYFSDSDHQFKVNLTVKNYDEEKFTNKMTDAATYEEKYKIYCEIEGF